MSDRTVLLMSRGMRLHRYFRDMAEDLARDSRIVVLAMPEEIASFSALRGVEVHEYRSLDLVWDAKRARARLCGMAASTLLGTVRHIEQDLGISTYRAATNYLLYGQFVTEHHGRWEYMTSEKEILAAMAGAYEQLAPLFERYRPRAVYYETVDLISTYIALALAKKHRAFAFEFKFAPLTDGDMNLVYGMDRRNVMLEHLYRNPCLLREESLNAADRFVEGYIRKADASSYAAIHRRMILGNSPLNIRRFRTAVSEVSRLREHGRNVRRHARAAANRAWLRRNLTREIPRDPFVALFLQHSPEATTFSQIPRWAHQEIVVEQLALNAPAGLKILVKEHPRTYGDRGVEFFGRLKQLPNVVLCHSDVDNHALLSRAEAVVALTGAVGLEGILLGRKVGVLGRPFYSVFGGVRHLTFPEEIFHGLSDRAWQPHEQVADRRRFLAAFLQSSFPFGHGEGTEMWPAVTGSRWGEALRKTLDFIDDHGLDAGQFDPGL